MLVEVKRGDALIEHDAIGGIESYTDYWREHAAEVASHAIQADQRKRAEAWRAALREARERRYWKEQIMSKKIIRSAAERGDTHTGWQSGDPSPKLNTRVRQVYPTKEIPHKWAHQTQAAARNPQGNLFFEGPTLYSYRTGYPIASIYKRKGGETLVLHRTDKYSVTTAGHCYAAQRASLHVFDLQMEVPDVLIPSGRFAREYHDRNLAHLIELASNSLANAQRAMSPDKVADARRAASRALHDAERYMAFFGIRRKAPVFPADAWKAAEQRAQRIVAPDPVRDAAKYRAKVKREETARAALQTQFANYCAVITKHNEEVRAWNDAQHVAAQNRPDAAQYWREHGQFPAAPEMPHSTYSMYVDYKTERKFRAAGFEMPTILHAEESEHPEQVLLRVEGEEIVTSLGARVPLAAAPMVWNHVQLARKCGGIDTRSNTPGVRRLSVIRIGDYPLDRIDPDGTLHAGCHTITYAELELLARKLGLVS